MKMAFILFDDMTTLDLAGFHNAVTWLKKRNLMESLTWDFCSDKEEVTDDRGMRIKADRVLPPLSEYELIFVPGGMGTRRLADDVAFVDWIRTARDVPYKASVCTGALLLGAAGFTGGKTITTNPFALELLKPYCKEVVKTRAMRDGDVFTGGGITASVDLGLFVVETLTNKETAQEIQRLMDYPYYVPSASEPAAKYANCAIVGNFVYVSGKGPSGNPKGKLGEAYTTEEGYELARNAGTEVLAVLKSALGSLDKVKRVVKIQGFVNATAGFEEHHKVLNGCSDLMLEMLGERGSHARSVLGAVSLRDNLPVIIDSIFEI
ncbi:Atu1372/SO_1960 family protein [Cohnella panacarvi]|uniref:Atu1372/SO_1960 family protein n=1 Tax=Cohnella panacarvi TaxID=400776 RepID=UPI00047E3EC8|nr:Atu1372/SO_1960 family protein [Cohnella panacarvi]